MRRLTAESIHKILTHTENFGFIIPRMTLRSHPLSINPVVEITPTRITIRTSALKRALTLGVWSRLVVLDRERGVAAIDSRLFWFFHLRSGFDLSRIMDFAARHESEAAGGDEDNPYAASPEFFQRLSLRLELRDPRESVLIYSGTALSSAAESPPPCPERPMNLEQTFGALIDAIREMAGLRGEMERYHAEQNGQRCASCGRLSPGNHDNCMYCGGGFSATGASQA